MTQNHFFPYKIVLLCKKLTYESLFFIIITEPVAPGEESVRICCIKPAKVAQIHAQTHLERERERETEKKEANKLKLFTLIRVRPGTLVAKAAAFV